MVSAAVALIGAFIYGAADFFGGLAARRLRSIVVTATAALSGLVVLFALVPLLGARWNLEDVAWGALSGVFGVMAIALLYACLAIGPMSILSPVTAVTSAIAPMIWGLTIGRETLTITGYLGLGVALVAVVLVGFIPGQGAVRPSGRGLVMAIGSGLAIGAFLITLDQASDDSGLVPMIANRATNSVITTTIVIVMIIVAVRRGEGAASAVRAGRIELGATPTGHADLERASTDAAPTRSGLAGWGLAVVCGVLDVTANVLLLAALRLGDLSIVAALTALYPAGTILLAALMLRERVAAVQWLGLALALSAGVLLALA